MKGHIISGFAGIGKSYLASMRAGVIDLESTPFAKNWDVYSNVAIHMANQGYIVLVSAHRELRQMLFEKRAKYTYVTPSKEMKEDYINRYKERGNNPQFIETMETNWDAYCAPTEWEASESYTRASVRVLENDEPHLFNVIDAITYQVTIKVLYLATPENCKDIDTKKHDIKTELDIASIQEIEITTLESHVSNNSDLTSWENLGVSLQSMLTNTDMVYIPSDSVDDIVCNMAAILLDVHKVQFVFGKNKN